MTEEPMHLDEVKWPKKCASCDVIVDKTGWLFKHRLYCEKHKPVDVPTDTTNTSSSSSSSKCMCMNCGRNVDHVTHIISIGGQDIDLTICDDCEWLRVAAWNLKLNGMWKSTPKPEANT